ncbi:MAG: aminotransferase class III-fold pyridoxal phosphate-dependent enzyme [Chloroflexota bacterium]
MELFDHTPTYDAQTIELFVRKQFDMNVTAKKLPSERDQNFHLSTDEGQQYVLKVANGLEDDGFLEAQQQIWTHLSQKGIDFCPHLIPNKEGALSTLISSSNGQSNKVRLVTFLAGKPLGDAPWQSNALFYDLGHKLGRMDEALADFEHPATHRDFHWDLAQGVEVVRQHRHLVTDPEQRELIDSLLADVETYTVPLLPHLRQSVIHSDANDYNVITGHVLNADLYSQNQTVTGIIDFGDMVFSYTVGNLAIAAAYALLDKGDPLAVAAETIKGYHAANPLTDAEFAALFGLINLRLCVSVCMAAVQLAERPNDEYLAISQQPIRNTMPKLVNIPYGLATALFRYTCGLDPLPSAYKVIEWIQRQPIAPILGRDLTREKTLALDLSIGSPLLHGDIERNGEANLTSRVFGLMADEGARISIGRYNEPRLIYSHAMFDTGSGPLDERRTIHIGLDLFDHAETPIFAPMDGTVHDVGYNAGPQDYGGVILLAHQVKDNQANDEQPGDNQASNRHIFFTLYGHLSKESVAKLRPGQSIQAGDELARMGIPAENGGWTPHLHLQIILDDFGLGLDFPGVGLASQRDVWCALCPDPNLLVGIPAERIPPADDTFSQTLTLRQEKVGRNLSIGYRNHLKIVRGWRQYLWDHQGAKYLDAYNNVPHVGHCHPQVVEAGQRQMGILNTNTRYLHDFLHQYAERLSATMPDPLNVCFFVNSASEANELALRLARTYTGHKDIIVNESAYHGHTTSLIDISPYKHGGPGGRGAPDWVHTAPIADLYRGQYRATDPDSTQKYADDVQQLIQRLNENGRGLSGFIAETCPSVGGQIILPAGYLDAVYRYVRSAGGVTIADEVQTGYGRTGSHFYAFEAQQVVPDMVVLGKPIGNGHPIGAVVTTREIADAFDNGMEFFSTFGGNTVSCAVGLAVLDVLEQEPLQKQAYQVGEKLLGGMRNLMERYELVGDVRGAGLFLGMELVRDRETLEPAAAEASFVSNQLRERGILVGTDGPYHNVIKIRPPMPFSKSDAELLLENLDEILYGLR